jgi:hypothetical protein
MFGAVAYVGGGAFCGAKTKSSPSTGGVGPAGALRLHPHWGHFKEVAGLCRDGLVFSRGGFETGVLGWRRAPDYEPIRAAAGAWKEEAKSKSKSKSKHKSKHKSKDEHGGKSNKRGGEGLSPKKHEGKQGKHTSPPTLGAPAPASVADAVGFGGRLAEERDAAGLHMSQAKIKVSTETM